MVFFFGYDVFVIIDECLVVGVVWVFDEIKYQGLLIMFIVGSYFVFDDILFFVLLCLNKVVYSELC